MMAQLIAFFVAAAVAGDPESTMAINWNTILMAIIALAGSTITGVFAVYMSKLNAATQKVKENSEEAKKFSEVSAESLSEIHKAVNSKDTLTAKKIEDLQAQVLRLTEQKSTADAQLKVIATSTEVERLVAKERVSTAEHFTSAVPARAEAAAERTELAAEKTEAAAAKTETAVATLTESQISEMVKALNAELDGRRKKING